MSERADCIAMAPPGNVAAPLAVMEISGNWATTGPALAMPKGVAYRPGLHWLGT